LAINLFRYKNRPIKVAIYVDILYSIYLYLFIEMDLSAIHDPPEFVKIFQLAEMEAIRANKDPSTVLIRGFCGGKDGQQKDVVSEAIKELAVSYRERGIHIIFEEFNNDLVRNGYKWNATQTFTALLSADIHILPTHFHQGMLAKGGTDTWNMTNISKNIERLRYHLGTPCGKHLDCPVWSQNKHRLYDHLEALDLCLPTIKVNINCDVISMEDEAKIDE
jgi:hypothetical protein